MKSLEYEIIKEEKFKQVLVDIRLLVPLKRELVTKIALLTNILSDRCEKYNSKKKMNAILDELYGASISCKCTGYGQTEVVSLKLAFLNEKYGTKGQFKKALNLLKEMLYYPLLNEETLKEAKDVLKDNLLRDMDKPSKFAMKEALGLAGSNQSLSISVNGDVNDIDDISLEDIVNTHKFLLDNSNTCVMCVGDFDNKSTKKTLVSLFGREIKADIYPTFYNFKNANPIEKEIVKPTEQSQIVLVYETNKNVNDEDFWAYKLGCIILGQLPVSLLFSEVREKRSLCYSIHSSVFGFDGCLYISTGVNKDKIDEAKTVILQQVDRLVKGDFEDYLVDISKTMIINSYRSSLDDETSIVINAYTNKLINIYEDEEIFKEKINSITKEQIISSYNELSQPTIFILKGDKDE